MAEFVEILSSTTSKNADKNKSNSSTSSQNDDLLSISKENDNLENSIQLKENVSDCSYDEGNIVNLTVWLNMV